MKKTTLEVKHKTFWMKYSDVYFIDTIELYGEYLEEFNNKFSISESEIETLKTFVGHGHSDLTTIAGFLSGGMVEKKEDRTQMMYELKRLKYTVIVNQIKSLLDGEILVINSKGGYFPIRQDDEYRILETDEKKYTSKDIKINKWFGGKHFYAKVGEIDVVYNGDVKWNTEEDATKAAEKYMKKLNGRK